MAFYSEYVSAHPRCMFPGLVSYKRFVDYIPQYHFVNSFLPTRTREQTAFPRVQLCADAIAQGVRRGKYPKSTTICEG